MTGRGVGRLVTRLLAAALIVVSQWQVDLTASKIVGAAPSIIPPSARARRLMDFGYHRAAADLTWLATIQYFGGTPFNHPAVTLADWLNAVVTLDPDFEYPYLFGGIILPWQNQAEAAIALLDRGAARFPNNGLFPYYAGAAAGLHLKDGRRAARYFQQAVGKENTPPAAAILAGVNLTESDDRKVALVWWEDLLQTEQNETVLARAAAWRDHLLLVLRLEGLIATARARGQAIDNLEDLVRLGWLRAVPPSPLGRPLGYDPTTGRVALARPTS